MQPFAIRVWRNGGQLEKIRQFNLEKIRQFNLLARGEQESVPVVVMRHQPETVIQGSANAGIQAVLTAERSSRLSQREEKIESL
jgi:hypothetical protein